MPLQFTSVPEKDFSLGIDVRSSENQIPPGFVRDLLNADVVEKRARKRPGYQGYSGNIPVRITEVDYNHVDGDVCFILPQGVTLETSGISLENTPSSPLVVYGRSSEFASGTGPFTTDGDTVKYYSKFSVPTRKPLAAPGGTLVYPGTEHGLGTTNMFLNVVESLSLTNRSFQDIITNSVRINETSFDVSIDYTTYIDRNVFIYVASKNTVTGSSYVHAATGVGTGIQTISIPASTHALSNFNIIASIQQDTGTERLQVEADSLTIATNGDVTVTVNNGTGAPVDYYVILSSAPTANIVTGVVNASSDGTVTISGVTSPWVFCGIYLEQTPGGTKELVYPDDLSYDEASTTITMTFSNADVLARNFIVYYEYGLLRSNKLCVTDNTLTASGTDLRPQITMWGLEHNEIYLSPKELREGWVNHVDSYRRSGEQRLVSGLGGNIFSARTYTEAASQYAYAQLYPNLNTRTSANLILGPLFWETGSTPARTRGYITADNSATNWGTISAVSYDSGNGWTKYTVSLPSKAILDSTGAPTTLSSVISTTADLEDWLTVDGMSYARHNGVFRIRQVQDGSDEIMIWVENDSNSDDYDDSGVAGLAGVFTDQLHWSMSSPYIAEDLFISEAIGDSVISYVLSSSTTSSVSDGWTDLIQIPAGVLFTAQRSSNVIPLRSAYPSAVASTQNLVRGDMLSYTGINRLVRVQSVNPDQDRTVNISESANVATVTLQSGDTSYLASGNTILLTQAGVYSGTHVVLDVTSTTEFTFSTTETGSVSSGTMVGNTAQIDEILEWADTIGDTNVFTVDSRWIPVEAPDDSFDLTPDTYIRQLDFNSYVSQAFLRSTMVVDNMYLTDYDNEAYKFDGSSIYRSGLPAWQPGCFLTQETSGAAIVTDLRSIAFSAKDAATGRLTITFQDSNAIPIGSNVRLTGSTQTYTVQSYSDNGIAYYAYVDRALDSGVSASGTAAEIGTYRYYFRLNAVDVNGNIVASAATGFQDHVVELTGNAAVRLKLVGFPAWDIYDFDRLEVQIYRTKINTSAPFYLITTLPMSFNNSLGYLTFRDSFADQDLLELDIVNTALKGTELGTAWSDPLRAKYITSIGNRQVLGNVKDYPQLDIQIVGDATTSDSAFAGDTLLFRRDNFDTGTTTNMVDRVKYEWINGTTGTPSGITTAANSFTVTGIVEPVTAGSWIYLTYSTVATTGRDLTLSGWWQVSSVTGAGPYDATILYTGLVAPASSPNRYVLATNPTDVPVLLGTDGNLGMVNGDSFDVFDAMRRMSMAVNSSMRMVDITATGMSEFTPWLMARSGNDTPPAGRLIVRQPRSDDSTFECIPTFSGYNVFINSIRRLSGDQISASTRVYPSRILVSYENYPEIFDNPTSILDSDSDSAIDINSADGQEITGIIPFFGSAAFGAAQQSGILVVFKTNSIYLIDINQKVNGLNAVQRIETQGLGCTAPYSIAVTKNGIMFANESGIYCLRQSQSIDYIGRYMERNWTGRVDKRQLDILHGHHYGIGRLYKLSVPILSTEDTTTSYVENSEAYVYNHTGEDEGRQGAWSRYDNHPAIGWANLASNAFFAATSGRVFSIRNLGEDSDFRDDSSSINMVVQTRANDFGDTARRKVLDKVLVDYRVGAESTETVLSFALDLESEYTATQAFTVTKPTDTTGLSDRVARDVVSIMHSLGRRRGNYVSIQISNNEMDRQVEIAGITYRIAGLTDRGTLQAAQTR